MNVEVYNEQTDLKIDLTAAQRVATEVISLYNRKCDEVVINFVSKEVICQLHKDHFNDPSLTDCISFPMDQDAEHENSGFNILGEIFVCPFTALFYARQNDLDEYEELTLYTVHALLHLLGFDDLNDADRALMRAAEKKCMTHLKSQNMLIIKSN